MKIHWINFGRKWSFESYVIDIKLRPLREKLQQEFSKIYPMKFSGKYSETTEWKVYLKEEKIYIEGKKEYYTKQKELSADLGRTFTDYGLAKVGTLVEFEDGKRFLIGDCCAGGVGEDGEYGNSIFDENDIVRRYAILYDPTRGIMPSNEWILSRIAGKKIRWSSWEDGKFFIPERICNSGKFIGKDQDGKEEQHSIKRWYEITDSIEFWIFY